MVLANYLCHNRIMTEISSMNPIVNINKDIAVVSRTISLKVNILEQIINLNFKYLRLRKFIEKDGS